MNKTLSEIQAELKVWTEYNFGQQESIIPIMGMIEELGELTHAHLKELQGIRKSDFLADKKDAIGDITIYLLNYFNCIGKNIRDTNILALDREIPSIIININFYVSRLAITVGAERGYTRTSLNSAEMILKFLHRLCNKLDIDFITTVNEVWEQVKLRDWRKYPKDGRTE